MSAEHGDVDTTFWNLVDVIDDTQGRHEMVRALCDQEFVRKTALFLIYIDASTPRAEYEDFRHAMIGTVAKALDAFPDDVDRALRMTEQILENEEQPRG